MRRLFIYLIVGTMAVAAIRALHHRHERPTPTQGQGWRYAGHPHGGPPGRSLADEKRRAQQAVSEARRAMVEAGREARNAWHEARDEMGRAYREARDEIREAYHEVLADVDGRRPTEPVPPPPPPAPDAVAATEEADGLPVRIVPGTRVTQAEVRPPVASGHAGQFRRTAQPGSQSAGTATPTKARNPREVQGLVCATEDRAGADARRALQVAVAEWLEPDVPSGGMTWSLGPDGSPIGGVRQGWTPPARSVESMIVAWKLEPYFSPKFKEEGPLYIATVTADFSPQHRASWWTPTTATWSVTAW